MVRGMTYQWPKDVSQLLDHAISDCIPTGCTGPKVGVFFMYLGSP